MAQNQIPLINIKAHTSCIVEVWMLTIKLKINHSETESALTGCKTLLTKLSIILYSCLIEVKKHLYYENCNYPNLIKNCDKYYNQSFVKCCHAIKCSDCTVQMDSFDRNETQNCYLESFEVRFQFCRNYQMLSNAQCQGNCNQCHLTESSLCISFWKNR